MKQTQPGHQAGLFCMVAAAALVGVVQAQPNPTDQGKGANPPNWPQAGGRRNMTPEQQQQLMAQNREQQLRRVLTAGGFPDKAVQDPIVAFANDQDKARLPLRASFMKVAQAVRGGVLKDTETATLLNDLKQSVEDEKIRHEQALKALDAKIGYTKKPRLEALLTVLGLVGDASTYATNGGLLGGRGGGLGGGGLAGGLGGGRNGGGRNGGGLGGFGGNNGLGGNGGLGGFGGRNGRRGGRGGFGGGGQGGAAAGNLGGGAADAGVADDVHV